VNDTRRQAILAPFLLTSLAAMAAAQQPPSAPPATEAQETGCTKCHGNAELMVGELKRRYVTEQDLVGDIHWQKGLRCHDCHGNHGALAPEIGSVANVCGTCHVKIGELFANTTMKHRFEEIKLPGCAACHGNRNIRHPTDEMLGMFEESVCTKCHNQGQFGATFVGARVAQDMRRGLDELKAQISETKAQLDHAERLGMEVREVRFHLRGADDALKKARTVIHSFSLDATNQALDNGRSVCNDVAQVAADAVWQFTYRRIWLALSLLPIFVVIGILVLYIRTLPAPTIDRSQHHHV
jgi:hypothetical protein